MAAVVALPADAPGGVGALPADAPLADAPGGVGALPGGVGALPGGVGALPGGVGALPADAPPADGDGAPPAEPDITSDDIDKAIKTLDALYSNITVKTALAHAVARANILVQKAKPDNVATGAGGTQRVGTKKRKRRRRRGKGTGKNKPLSEVNVVL